MALAYYWDNREELDTNIDERSAVAARLRSDAGPSPLAERLAAAKNRR